MSQQIPPFTPVVSDSGNIIEARTDGVGVVQVRFKGGRLYQNNKAIPADLCGQFADTFGKPSGEASTGAFFHKHLKAFEFTVVPEDDK